MLVYNAKCVKLKEKQNVKSELREEKSSCLKRNGKRLETLKGMEFSSFSPFCSESGRRIGRGRTAKNQVMFQQKAAPGVLCGLSVDVLIDNEKNVHVR